MDYGNVILLLSYHLLIIHLKWEGDINYFHIKANNFQNIYYNFITKYRKFRTFT